MGAAAAGAEVGAAAAGAAAGWAGAEQAARSCVHFVGESDESFAVTLDSGCDLREAARLFPQRDPQTHLPLLMQQQLRSIFAFNEKLLAEGQAKIRTVRHACVPTGRAPDDATPEEIEACPRGLTNYFGIASTGNLAVIRIPKTRTPTRAERLEALAKAACAV